MELREAKENFIQAWGQLGSNWGVSKAMAQIHALLLISPKPMSTDEIMKELNISRGNANMNVRELLSWGLAYKKFLPGERREYFFAEKDIWDVAKKVGRERKKRELEPVLKMVNEVKDIKGRNKHAQEFRKVSKEVGKFARKTETALDLISRANESTFFKWFMK
ncbi:MAG: transcriptional regulator [Bacteroidetes bacterium MED-G17]|jgi:DNA-binding transcriptional regulator GbsR (MarR family)|nr:MAG: transcriptional regulator [Bacteroidetes bacterium TMED39]PDH52175.1 MAG: transcriptional regulator [Bacteroidetes bacterium MED-G17]|tara:strand:- start:7766 stop:8257 length:492 start_codon:yes stop_codon:yes gene_type:complete